MPEGGLGPDCKYVISGLAGAVVGLCLVILKLAKYAWDERMNRLNDHMAAQEQINVAKRVAREKGGSPQ